MIFRKNVKKGGGSFPIWKISLQIWCGLVRFGKKSQHFVPKKGRGGGLRGRSEIFRKFIDIGKDGLPLYVRTTFLIFTQSIDAIDITSVSKSLKQYRCIWCHKMQVEADLMSNVPMFQWSSVQMLHCSNDPMFQWCNVPMCFFFSWGRKSFSSIGPSVRSLGPLVHCSIGPLVHWTIVPSVYWSIGPLFHWLNVKCQMPNVNRVE